MADGGQPRAAGQRALATGCVPLFVLALGELLALAPVADLVRPRIWLLQATATLALGLFAALVGAGAAGLARAIGLRALSATEATGAVVAVLVGMAYLGATLLARLPRGAISPHGPGAAAAAAVCMLAVYAPLRLALARRSVPLAALLGLLVALAAIDAIGFASVRGARQADQLRELRVAIYATGVALAASACVAALLLHRLRGVTLGAVVAAGLLATRCLIPNAHDWTARADDGARPQSGPPVIFVVLDTFRADALDLRTLTLSKTPHLARLAARGSALAGIANASWTLPGHASLFTGLTLARHRTDATEEPGFSGTLAPDLPTSHEIFAKHGYRTVCVSANSIVGPSSGLSRGCQAYVNPGRAWMRHLLAWRLADLVLPSAPALDPLLLELSGVGPNASAREVVDRGLQAIQGEPHSLYLFLNFLDAHGPFAPRAGSAVPREERRALRGDYFRRMLGVTSSAEIMRRHRATLRAYYDAQVAELDAELGRLVAELETRGWLEPAVVLVTSDHGEGFAENPELEGYFGHHSAWEPAVRIPLILKPSGPPRPAGGGRVFQQVDVLPTLLEAAGLPPVAKLDGSPLAQPREGPLLTEWYRRAHAGSFPYFPGNRFAVYEGDLKYVREGEGEEHLYDLVASPYEQVDVAGRHPEVLLRLRRRLDEALQAAPRGTEPARPTDPAQLEQLRALGYVE